MGLLNEIRLWNWIRQVICETFEYVWTVESNMKVKLEIQMNLRQCRMSTTVERDENIKRDKTIEFLTMWIYVTVQWDMTLELEKNSEFAKLLNKWNCWIRWECKRDKTIEFLHF